MKVYRFLAPITWLNGMSHGYANGYVAVPPTHLAYESDYEDVYADVHGGITYCGPMSNFSNEQVTLLDGEIPDYFWVFGFDTAHFGDNLDNCDYEYCVNEVTKLAEQLEQWQNTI